MSSAKEPRKITSDKFTTTLPKEWRETIGLTKDHTLTPYYQAGSVLVLVPSNIELENIEVQLIELLLKYRNIRHTKTILGELHKVIPDAHGLADKLEQILTNLDEAIQI